MQTYCLCLFSTYPILVHATYIFQYMTKFVLVMLKSITDSFDSTIFIRVDTGNLYDSPVPWRCSWRPILFTCSCSSCIVWFTQLETHCILQKTFRKWGKGRKILSILQNGYIIQYHKLISLWTCTIQHSVCIHCFGYGWVIWHPYNSKNTNTLQIVRQH